jgi:hypothetical protein
MNHPHLTELFKIYQSEFQPFRKVHRMIDLFESIIKSHTVVIIAEYVKHNKLSEAAKGMLAQGLRTPSLGTWQLFSRILSEELNADGYVWTFTGFSEDFATLDKALNAAKTNVISFRNGYAHGATPTDEQCESDIRQFEPFLIQLLDSHWLSNTTLENRDNKVWIVSDTGELCLHPILLFKDEGGSSPYAFFNDLKNDKVGLLNYPLSKHYREKQFYQEFHQYLPLNEWKKSGNNEFHQRIEELTETFKGRTQERARLLDFVCNNSKGYFSIQGNPGIGKSALIAQFFKDIKSHKDTQQLQVVEYFIRRGTAQAQVEYVFNYLLRRTDELFPAGKEIRAEGKAVWDLQQQLFSKWRLWGEQNNGSKLLFLIDGLDEGVENSVVTYVPRENFEGILIIYGSRPGGHKSIDDLWAQLAVEHHTKLELSGLGKEDIRALIYEVANKYELDRDSAWIDAVQRRSQGNPLYLKLLCDAMEHGSIVVNDIGALPEKIDEYYKAILDRYSRDADGDALLNGLFTFAAARDYLTMVHLGLINKLGEATVQRIGSTLKEVLYENPLTEDVLDYQLFHESFREYLIKEKGTNVREAAERIIDFCEGWKELEGTWEQRYALEHYAAHLTKSKKEVRVETLSRLIYDHGYTATQKKVLKGFDASNEMYRIALKKSCELKREDDMLEAALCLVDLKYEEANDAPQIVEMVANGEIDLALKRIESFGGADKEGMKRKFILYMLCLMELTLLDSKDKPFRKSAIEKLLNHLDENIPVDHSLLNWNDFFSSYLVFKMACEWTSMELDFIRLLKRTRELYLDWIAEIGPYNDLQFQVLLEFARVSIYARGISGYNEKNEAIKAISTELAKQGKLEESLDCARGINDNDQKSKALSAISTELTKQGKLREGESVMQQSLEYARGISGYNEKNEAFKAISTELAKQGKLEESLECARGISDDDQMSKALSAISTELTKQGKLTERESVMQQSLEYARGISGYNDKNEAFKAISTELAKQGKLEESLECARCISYDRLRSEAFTAISTELAKQGKLEESLECARGISDDDQKSKALSLISTELAKKGKLTEGESIMQQSLECAWGIGDDDLKSEAFIVISMELVKQGKLTTGHSVMQQLLECTRGISNDDQKSKALSVISTELAKRGKLEESLECARGISDDNQKCKALLLISTELAKQGKFKEGESVMQDSYECARGIDDNNQMSKTLSAISTELAKQGKLEESIECARGISDYEQKSKALSAISTELAKQGKLTEGESVMQQSLECARGISDDWKKINTLVEISKEYTHQEKNHESYEIINEALLITRKIKSERVKPIALLCISSELERQGIINKSIDTLKEATEAARSISGKHIFFRKSMLLIHISAKYHDQGRIEESGSILQEALGIALELPEWNLNAQPGRSNAMRPISIELARKDDMAMALKIGKDIAFASVRHTCWELMANTIFNRDGTKKSLELISDLPNGEFKTFYKKGWTDSLRVEHLQESLLIDSLAELVEETTCIEKILYLNSLKYLFLEKINEDKIRRLSQTLNLQWALDIIAKFPTEEIQARLSSNLTDWIDQIPDEDDRDQISLWAKQVAKGKISEAEFEEKVKSIN